MTEVMDEESSGMVISGKCCQCGSTEHKRTTHKSCPGLSMRNDWPVKNAVVEFPITMKGH